MRLLLYYFHVNDIGLFITLFQVHNIDFLIDLYNGSLQTTIILFMCKFFSQKINWIIFILSLLALSWIFLSTVSSLINALEGEYFRPREISCSCSVITACLLSCPLFYYTDVIVIFLFIRWSCKQSQYSCFWSFLFHFSFPFFVTKFKPLEPGVTSMEPIHCPIS